MSYSHRYLDNTFISRMGVINTTVSPCVSEIALGKGDGTTSVPYPPEAQRTMFDIERGDVLWFSEETRAPANFLYSTVPVLSQLYRYKPVSKTDTWGDFYSKIAFQGIAEANWTVSDVNKYDKTGLASQLAGTCSLVNITDASLKPGQYLQWGLFDNTKRYPTNRAEWETLFQELSRRKGFPKKRFPLGFSISPISEMTKNPPPGREDRAITKKRLMAKVLSYSDPGQLVDVLLVTH